MTNWHPILFRGDMVRAIFDGTKHVTRRLVKPQPTPSGRHDYTWRFRDVKARGNEAEICASILAAAHTHRGLCRYGVEGHYLWGRETWGLLDTEPDDGPERATVFYRATDGDRHDLRHQLWRPSIFMPRWASRIALKIARLRVERLHEITGEEARREGIRLPVSKERVPLLRISGPLSPIDFCDRHPKVWTIDDYWRFEYANLWEEMHGKSGHGWKVNPLVFGITFKRVKARA